VPVGQSVLTLVRISNLQLVTVCNKKSDQLPDRFKCFHNGIILIVISL